MSDRVFAYFDGFNFYYGAVRNTEYKWINIKTLVQLHIDPTDSIVKVKYFTARVKSQPDDPHQPNRQQLYFRALETIPEFELILGFYLEKIKKVRLKLKPKPIRNFLASIVHPSLIFKSKDLIFAKAIIQEEKGSDVNLASHLLNDAHLNAFDHAIVITGDSDLVEPIKIIVNELKKKVTVINPQIRPSAELKRVASKYHNLNPKVLGSCLFPPNMTDAVGPFHKPPTW